MTKTITSANAVLLLSIEGLFNAPLQLQGFAVDDVFDIDSVQSTETAMGVDGKMSAGFIPAPIVQNIMLMADSASVGIFEQWYLAQQSIREVYFANGSIVLPSVQRSYSLRRGVLTGYTPAPSAKKTLQPRKFTVTWESVTSAGVRL